jgi:CBS domain-containing protein
MNVESILKMKGSSVVTVPPEAGLMETVEMLRTRKIGAVVVSGDGRTVDGILSERDVVRALGARGKAALDAPVRTAMTDTVVTCRRSDSVETVMSRMTEGRFRHVPVIEDGALAGMISIGDVVKARLEELSAEAEQLKEFIAGR